MGSYLEKYSDDELFLIFDANIEDEIKSRGYEYGWHKKVKYAGVIYILVNPAFPNLIKIGYAKDVMKRLKSLNSNSGLPDPYHIYATYKVKKPLEDLKLHGLIDSLDSDLRHAKNREFYEMTPEKAYGILSAIAQINGDEDLLVLNPLDDEYFKNVETVVDKKHYLIESDNAHRKTSTKDRVTVPDGIYTLKRYSKADGNDIHAKALVVNGSWMLLKGSVLSRFEGAGLNSKARVIREQLLIDTTGELLEDFELGEVSPSFAGAVVINQSCAGWDAWKSEDGTPIDIYRRKTIDD